MTHGALNCHLQNINAYCKQRNEQNCNPNELSNNISAMFLFPTLFMRKRTKRAEERLELDKCSPFIARDKYWQAWQNYRVGYLCLCRRRRPFWSAWSLPGNDVWTGSMSWMLSGWGPRGLKTVLPHRYNHTLLLYCDPNSDGRLLEFGLVPLRPMWCKLLIPHC